MAQYADAKIIRMSELESFCPPKHVNTDSFAMMTEDLGVSRFVLYITEIHPGGEAQLDVHEGREHCYFIMSGLGEAQVDGKKFTLHPGDCLWIPPDAEHGVKPVGGQTLRFAVVTAPAPWIDV